MPFYKYTFIYQMTTNPTGPQSRRTGGWSESWYWSTPDASVTTTCNKRAALLPPQAAIVGYRVQQVDPAVGKGRSFALNFPGQAPETDQPQAGLLITAGNAISQNVGRRVLRCFPDSWITGGELNTTGTGFLAAWNDFRQYMRNSWRIRGVVQTAAVSDIVGANNVTIAGTDFVWFTTLEPHGLVTGDVVRVSRVTATDNLPLGTKTYTVTDDSTYTFQVRESRALPLGATGLARKYAIDYPLLTDLEYSRVVTRKVGRAPFQYVGRA